jgi:hypothetical protein
VVAVVAGCGRRVHGDDHFRTGLADDAHDPGQGVLAVPDLLRERGADSVVEIHLVQVVDVVDASPADGASLLGLADEPERRTLLRTYRVTAALAAGDGDDAGLDSVVLVPLAVGGEAERLVVRVRPDEQHVQVRHALLRPGLAGRGAGYGDQRYHQRGSYADRKPEIQKTLHTLQPFPGPRMFRQS